VGCCYSPFLGLIPQKKWQACSCEGSVELSWLLSPVEWLHSVNSAPPLDRRWMLITEVLMEASFKISRNIKKLNKVMACGVGANDVFLLSTSQ
jgi:hypothetical protein